jgi:hypothetical protein
VKWYAGVSTAAAWGRRCVYFLELQAKRATVFIGRHFYLMERLADKLWLLSHKYLAATCLKINKVNLSLQRKQETMFVVSDKIWGFLSLFLIVLIFFFF